MLFSCVYEYVLLVTTWCDCVCNCVYAYKMIYMLVCLYECCVYICICDVCVCIIL